MSDTTYNGWSNYPTWAVHLWLTNDEEMMNATAELVNLTYGEAFQDDDFAGAEYARSVTADALEAWVQGMSDEVTCCELEGSRGMVCDLLGYVFGQVNWHEIVRAFLDN